MKLFGSPQTAEEYRERAFSYVRSGKCDKALADANEAIRLDPEHPDGFGARGMAKTFMGDHRGGIVDLNEAIRRNPEFVSAYLARGFARRGIRDFDGALKDYEKAQQLGNNRETRKLVEASIEEIIKERDTQNSMPLKVIWVVCGIAVFHLAGRLQITTSLDWKVVITILVSGVLAYYLGKFMKLHWGVKDFLVLTLGTWPTKDSRKASGSFGYDMLNQWADHKKGTAQQFKDQHGWSSPGDNPYSKE